MKFKIGDKVKVIEKGSHSQNIGDIGEVIAIDKSDSTYKVEMDTDGDNWWFYENEIDYKKPTKEELFKLPIGTKITIDGKEDNVFLKLDNESFENSDYLEYIDERDIEGDLSIKNDDFGTKITKIEVPKYEIIFEQKNDVKEMTVAEISEALGYEVKIIKEKNNE